MVEYEPLSESTVWYIYVSKSISVLVMRVATFICPNMEFKNNIGESLSEFHNGEFWYNGYVTNRINKNNCLRTPLV